MRKSICLVTLMLLTFLTGCGKKEEQDLSTDVVNVSAGNFNIVTNVIGEATPEGTVATDTTTVQLSLTDKLYYNIKIPADVSYVTDYAKYVYGEDPNFTVTVLSNVSESNFSRTLSIDKAVTLTKNCVRTKEGVRGPQEAAVLIDDKVVVVRCYNAPDVFATVLSCFVDENNKPYEVTGIRYDKYYKTLMSLSYKGTMVPTAVNQVQIGSTMLFKFDGGSMYATKQLKTFNDCKSCILKKLNTVSGCVIDEEYEDSNFYYAKAGDFYVGVYKENYNTQLVAFGSGEESLCNIIFLLNQCLQ